MIRLITRNNKYESYTQKFKENRILTVTSIYVLEVLCYIKKYEGDLKHNCEIHEYNTRSLHDPLYYRVNPDILSLVGDPLPGNGCGSPNHMYLAISFCLFTNHLLLGTKKRGAV